MAKNLQTVARRALTPCSNHDAFRFADGSTVRDLETLCAALNQKSPRLVDHHRTEYAQWVGSTLGDNALARKMRRLARQKALEGPQFQEELTQLMDERIRLLRDRVI